MEIGDAPKNAKFMVKVILNDGICLGALSSKQINLLPLPIVQRIICPRPSPRSRPFCPPKWPFRGDLPPMGPAYQRGSRYPFKTVPNYGASSFLPKFCTNLNIISCRVCSHERHQELHQLAGPYISCCPSAVSAQSPRTTPKGSCRFLSILQGECLYTDLWRVHDNPIPLRFDSLI